MPREQASSLTPPYCKSCIYRSTGKTQYNMCQYSQVTSHLRGCAAGPDCVHKTTKDKSTRARAEKPKRVLLTDEEKRERRNALHKAERAKKKAAKLLEQSDGAHEI